MSRKASLYMRDKERLALYNDNDSDKVLYTRSEHLGFLFK